MSVNQQKPLTPKQNQVLEFISDFIEKNKYSPSLREIAEYFKKSISTAQHFVEELAVKGYLNKEENSARAINPINKQKSRIPLLGFIAAGEPIEPIENPELISIPKTMISPPGQYYALKVQGSSMIDDGICDGDTVVIKHQLTAESGDTIVAVTEKGATLKTLKKKNGKIFLEPKNKKLKKIYPQKLEIRGKFCGLIRTSVRNTMDNLTKKQRIKCMSRIRSKDTKPEQLVRKILTKLGWRYRLHVGKLPGKPDIVLSKIKTAIFINGCFWHQHNGCQRKSMPKTNAEYWKPKLKKNIQKQKEDIKKMKKEGWRVFVIWECDAKDQKKLTAQIKKMLS